MQLSFLNKILQVKKQRKQRSQLAKRLGNIRLWIVPSFCRADSSAMMNSTRLTGCLRCKTAATAVSHRTIHEQNPLKFQPKKISTLGTCCKDPVAQLKQSRRSLGQTKSTKMRNRVQLDLQFSTKRQDKRKMPLSISQDAGKRTRKRSKNSKGDQNPASHLLRAKLPLLYPLKAR